MDANLLEDISLKTLNEGLSSMRVNHFIDVRLVGFKKNGNGNIFLNEKKLFEYLDLLGQYVRIVHENVVLNRSSVVRTSLFIF